jgi:hypothetical protein
VIACSAARNSNIRAPLWVINERRNSKDRVVLRNGLKRGYRRVVLDRQVVPTTRGDLAPSLKDELPRGFLPRGFSDACRSASPRACTWQASENP